MPRRLLLLVGLVVLVDTALYAALAPLLPALEQELGLSKAQAGVLVGAYPAGTFLGALPGGWLAARFGPRPILMAGLALMTISGVTFALAESLAVLDIARFAQGLGGALTWISGLAWLGDVAVPERRGEALGFAIGAAVFGAQFGPVIGVAAETAGRQPVFLAVAALGVALAAIVRAEPPPVAPPQASRRPATLLRDRWFVASLWVAFLPALAFGVIEVLVPLRLDDLGFGAVAIGVAFVIAALLEAVLSPLAGRWADRAGVVPVVRAGTVVGVAALGLIWVPERALLVAVLLCLLAVAAGLMFTPSGRLTSTRAEALDVGQGWAFAFANLAWSGGITVGAVAGGGAGQAAGDWLPYLVCAALFVLTGIATLQRRLLRPDTALGSPA